MTPSSLLLIVLGLLASGAVAGTIAEVCRDGYRRVPTRRSTDPELDRFAGAAAVPEESRHALG